MLDLTDFSQVPRSFVRRSEPVVVTPIKSEVRRRVMAPVDPGLISPEMRESQEREERRPESLKKTHWNINDFEGLPYNAEDAARIRKERGIPESKVDDMIKNSERLD